MLGSKYYQSWPISGIGHIRSMEYASPRALRKLTEPVDVTVKRIRADEGLDPPIGQQRFQ